MSAILTPQARKDLRERAAQNLKAVRQALGLDALDADGEGDEDGDGEEGSLEGAEAGAAPITTEFEDDEQIATVVITEDFDPALVSTSHYLATHTTDADADVDVDAEALAITSAEASSSSTLRPTLPEIPASSKRAQAREKREKALAATKREREKLKSKRETEKGRSMETKAERRKGKAMEAKRRVMKSHLAMDRDGPQRGGTGVRGARGARGGGGRGRGGRGGGRGRSGQGKKR
jgi:ribosomal RNA-processing protein 17